MIDASNNIAWKQDNLFNFIVSARGTQFKYIILERDTQSNNIVPARGTATKYIMLERDYGSKYIVSAHGIQSNNLVNFLFFIVT